jgi:hypothetical protein
MVAVHINPRQSRLLVNRAGREDSVERSKRRRDILSA